MKNIIYFSVFLISLAVCLEIEGVNLDINKSLNECSFTKIGEKRQKLCERSPKKEK